MLYPPVSDSGAAESAHPGKKRQPTITMHAPCHSKHETQPVLDPMNPMDLHQFRATQSHPPITARYDFSQFSRCAYTLWNIAATVMVQMAVGLTGSA